MDDLKQQTTRMVNRMKAASAFVDRLKVKTMTDDQRTSLAAELLALGMPRQSVYTVTGVIFEREAINATD